MLGIGLEFMGKDWDSWDRRDHTEESKINEGVGTFLRASKNLSKYTAGQSFQDWCKLWATEALRVLKPGGFMFAMGGTRTHHRLTCGIEDAGFMIRDELCWVYMQGFPKAQDLGMMIEKKLGGEGQTTTTTKAAPTFHTQNVGGTIERTDTWDSKQPTLPLAKSWQGWKTPALKPAFEPIVVAQKPCEGSITENVMKHGVGGYNIDECRIGNEDIFVCGGKKGGVAYGDWAKEVNATHQGRYPSNVMMLEPCFDGKEGIVKVQDKPNTGHVPRYSKGSQEGHIYSGAWGAMTHTERYFENTSFSKFFLIPKASKGEKEKDIKNGEETFEWGAYGNGIGNVPKEGNLRPTTTTNPHPTVKPVALMQHLIKLTTKPLYTVLDPFLGSGTTAVAALQLNRNVIGIELNEEYMKIAKARIAEEVKQTRLF